MQMNCELWYVGCLLSRDPKLKAWDFYDFGHVMLFKPPKELCFVFFFFFHQQDDFTIEHHYWFDILYVPIYSQL